MPLVSLTVFSLPFTAWFALGPWLRLPVIFLLIMFFVTVLYAAPRKFGKVKFDLGDCLVFLFALVCAFSGLANIDQFVAKDVNNFIAIMFVAFVMYLVPKKYFECTVTKCNIAQLNNAIAVSYMVASAMVIADFLLVNLLNYRVYDLFVISRVGNADYFVRGGGLITPAGPAEEPAATAFFLNILFFLALAYNQRSLIKNTCLFLWHLLCLIALGSSAGLVFFVLSIFFASLFFFEKKYLKWYISSAALVLLFYPYLLGYLNSISLIDKVFFREENVSSSLRISSWMLFYESLFDDYKEILFGHSPAYSKLVVETGFHSSYFTILSNYGLIAFALYILFMAHIFHYAMRQNLFVLAAFLVIIFNSAVGDYYYQPIIWISLVIIVINQVFWQYKKASLDTGMRSSRARSFF